MIPAGFVTANLAAGRADETVPLGAEIHNAPAENLETIDVALICEARGVAVCI